MGAQHRTNCPKVSYSVLDVGVHISSDEESPDSTPPVRALRSMQTGQNSIAPENSLPQIEQVRWGLVVMNLTVLRLR
jgi:hypothetical protein